jgi:hypothetical protein
MATYVAKVGEACLNGSFRENFLIRGGGRGCKGPFSFSTAF